MSLRRKFLLLFPIVALLVMAGCKVKTINFFPPHPANVRVINLLVDAPGIDVSVNGSPTFNDVAFEQLTGYQSFDNQATPFTVTLSGSTTPLATFTYNLAGEQPYTLLVFGTTGLVTAALFPEVPQAPTNGQIQLSVFNASINSTGFDVYVTAPGVDLTTVNPNYFNVLFNGATLNLAFAPGTYEIRVTLTGSKTVIYDSGGTVLSPNIALAFIAYSRGSGVLVNAEVLQSQGPGTILNNFLAQLKAINGADGVGPVNQLLGTTLINANVGFGTSSIYNVAPVGLTTINFESSATPGATIASLATTLAAATDSSTFVVGPPGAQQAYVLTDQNFPPFPGNTRLRFINASYNSNPVNISVNNVVQVSNLAFPNASAYVQVVAGVYPITFTDAVTGAVVLTIPSQTLVANQTVSIYMIGPQGAVASIVTQDN